MEQEMSAGDTCFDSSFKTVDSSDYSSIGNRVLACLETVIYTDLLIFVTATIDVKKGIYGLAVNCYDTQIALVENQGGYNSIQESVVRLYDVGRRKDDEDEQVNNQIYNYVQRAFPIPNVDMTVLHPTTNFI